MWRKFFKIFGFRVCQLQDFDGEVRTRFIRKDAFGLSCRLWFCLERLRLNHDGTVTGISWVERWKEI
jgi:hypothetical protein